MNILYLYGNSIDPQKGGVQRVTDVLSIFFESQGNKVFYLSKCLKGEIYNNYRQYYLPENNDIVSPENIRFLINFIYEKNIDIVINQSGLDPEISKLAYHVKNTNAKLISCVHNAIITHILNFESTYYNLFKKYKLAWILPLFKYKFLKYFILKIYKFKYSLHYKNLCLNSDNVVLLSHSFIKDLVFFVGENFNISNVLAISNPLSFESDTNSKFVKKKQLLFVGRIDNNYKRVDLLIDIWEKVSQLFLDWNLKVVGDGPDLEPIKKDCVNRGLKRISFEGFKDPIPYYKESSIFCMTSSSEGFGLVLVEAMSFGVVPVAFNSYASVTDIIDDKINGFLITPFKTEEYVCLLSDLMNKFDHFPDLSFHCLAKAKQFSIDTIGQKWLSLFNYVVK